MCAQCSISTGYLYSKHMGSFICKPIEDGIKGSQPVLFTIKTGRNPNSRIKVLSIGNKCTMKFSMILSPSGSLKFLKGNRCETVRHHNIVTPGRCTRSRRQDFIWVPENMFSQFVEKMSLNPKQGRGRRDRMLIAAEKKKINELSGIMQDIRGNISQRIRSSLPSIPPGTCEQTKETSCNQTNPVSLGQDRLIKQYLDYYHKTTPSAVNLSKPTVLQGNKNSSNMCPQENAQDQCSKFAGLMKSSISLINDDYMKNFSTIVNDIGPDAFGVNSPYIYQSKVPRPRKRGIFARGEDSQDLNPAECRCKFECVRNPKNGLCFYKTNGDGKLIPIMKDEQCCKKVKQDPCNIENNLERHLCELITRNDFGFFSKFLDQNYAPS